MRCKFRVWDSSAGQMFQWEDIGKDMLKRILLGELPNFIPMLSTGLHDRNGVEIWEGDIVAYFNFYGVRRTQDVKWGEGYWIPLVQVEHGYNAIDNYSPEDFEVIGNAWENPELVEGE